MTDYLEELVALFGDEEEEQEELLLSEFLWNTGTRNPARNDRKDAGEENQASTQAESEEEMSAKKQTIGESFPDRLPGLVEYESQPAARRAENPLWELAGQEDGDLPVRRMRLPKGQHRVIGEPEDARTAGAASDTADLDGMNAAPSAREGEGTGALWNTLVQTRRAARYRVVSGSQRQTGAEMGQSLPKSAAVVSTGVEARQVDRIFERDARRYDSGFTLF